MTIWSPSTLAGEKAKYFSIADALARDIDHGRLAPGQRLPTHRSLADQLGITVGTVSRGYAEARRRGLVVGEVGRGTFVRSSRPDEVRFAMKDRNDPDLIDLSMNIPVAGRL